MTPGEEAERGRQLVAEAHEAREANLAKWLRGFLEVRGREQRRRVYEWALRDGYTKDQVDRAAAGLGLVLQGSAPDWVLPPKPAPAPQGYPTTDGKGELRQRVPMPEEVRVMRRAPTAALAVELLRRKAYHKTLGLLELTERERRDGVPCPSCGRGMPRAEETRLKAILAVLDRAGMGAKAEVSGGAVGPLIVFPPGTRIGVLASTRGDAEVAAEDARRAAGDARDAAVEAEVLSLGAERLAVAVAAADRVTLRRASEIPDLTPGVPGE